jgi:hypothetical protein
MGMAEAAPPRTARIAGAIYVLVFISGIYAVMRLPGAEVANLIAGVCYIAVTVLFYFIFRPAGRGISLLAAAVSLAGIAWGMLTAAGRAPLQLNPLVFFGVYCLLIGWLIFRSRFLPHLLGWGMVIGGLGWLTFVSHALGQSLFPWNLAPGMIGEGALTLWLVVKGVDEARWKQQTAA